MNKIKICRTCRQAKIEQDAFYTCSGRSRSECKQCTIDRNGVYQKALKTWKDRYVDEDARRAYMREYYSTHKEKFAEYRQVFKARHPNYYRDYRDAIKGRKEIGEDFNLPPHTHVKQDDINNNVDQ